LFPATHYREAWIANNGSQPFPMKSIQNTGFHKKYSFMSQNLIRTMMPYSHNVGTSKTSHALQRLTLCLTCARRNVIRSGKMDLNTTCLLSCICLQITTHVFRQDLAICIVRHVCWPPSLALTWRVHVICNVSQRNTYAQCFTTNDISGRMCIARPRKPTTSCCALRQVV
jgi:hypothetical protein